MRYFKIVNPLNVFNQNDYKGLNIDLFIGGSQEYKNDDTVVLIATNEDVSFAHPDLTELVEADYISQRQDIKTFNSQTNPPIDLQVKDLQAQNAQMILALVTGGLI